MKKSPGGVMTQSKAKQFIILKYGLGSALLSIIVVWAMVWSQINMIERNVFPLYLGLLPVLITMANFELKNYVYGGVGGFKDYFSPSMGIVVLYGVIYSVFLGVYFSFFGESMLFEFKQHAVEALEAKSQQAIKELGETEDSILEKRAALEAMTPMSWAAFEGVKIFIVGFFAAFLVALFFRKRTNLVPKP